MWNQDHWFALLIMLKNIFNMLHRFFKYTLPFLLLITLSSCFEIKEKVYLKKDGSGTYSFLVNLSMYKNSEQSFKDYLSKSPQKETFPVEKLDPSKKILIHFSKMEFYLETVKGITDYKVINDSINHLIGATCSFANIEALNHFIHVLLTGKNEGKPEIVYTYDNKSFTRNDRNLFNEQIVLNTSPQDTLTSIYLVNSKYHTEFNFEKKYSTYNNNQYLTNQNKESLIFNSSLKELKDLKRSAAIQVSFIH